MLDLSFQSLSHELAQRRKGLGWSQQKLAARAGVSLPGIQLLESSRGNPSWSTLQAVASALGIEVLFRKPEASLAEWAALGLPISDAGARPGARPLSRADWVDRMAVALAGIQPRDSEPGSRFQDALAALLLAVRDHYPSAHAELARGAGFKQVWTCAVGPTRERRADPGRILKLRRVALSHLARML